jgi:cyclophilin family peptidyl-prolyl cis-trans isomerase
MTVPSPSLDGQYSAFGELVDGFAALDTIARAPGIKNDQDGTVRPASPQKIESALVLVKSAK